MADEKIQEIIERRKSSMSFRIEGVGTDAKIYFEDEADLKVQLQAIKNGWELKKQLFGV